MGNYGKSSPVEPAICQKDQWIHLLITRAALESG